MRPKILHDEQGFALAKVVILAGIGLAITAGSLKLMDNRLKIAKIMNARSRITMLESRVRNAGTSLSAYYESSRKNANAGELAKCMAQTALCQSTKPASFRLFNSFGDRLSGQFDINGAPCNENCEFEVKTNYQFTCAGGASSCSFPEIITTDYTINHINRKYTSGYKIPSITGSADLATYLCPNNQVVRGIDANGKFICDQPSDSMYSTTCAEGAAYGITAEGDLRCAKITDFCNKDLALAVIMDTSGSMSVDYRMTASINAGSSFIDYLKAQDQVGLVEFNDSSWTHNGLTGSFANVKYNLSRFYAFGGTNMNAGLVSAGSILQAAAPKAIKGIIFLSDGWYNMGPAPFAAADKLKADGVTIWSVALGDGVDVYTLRSIASTPDDYFYVPDPSDLKNAFDRISMLLCRSK